MNIDTTSMIDDDETAFQKPSDPETLLDFAETDPYDVNNGLKRSSPGTYQNVTKGSVPPLPPQGNPNVTSPAYENVPFKRNQPKAVRILYSMDKLVNRIIVLLPRVIPLVGLAADY